MDWRAEYKVAGGCVWGAEAPAIAMGIAGRSVKHGHVDGDSFVSFTVEAEGHADAIEAAEQVFTQLWGEPDLGLGGRILRMTVEDEIAGARERGILVGVAKVAEILDVTPNWVQKLSAEDPDFPPVVDPDAPVKLWIRWLVEGYATKERPKVGRPPKVTS